MEAFFLPISKNFSPLLFFLIVFGFSNCKQKTERKIVPSFYYWKTSFSLTEKEALTLRQLSIQNLYVKFFDVSWEEFNKRPMPVALINLRQSLPEGISITPVVFITNETIRQS